MFVHVKYSKHPWLAVSIIWLTSSPNESFLGHAGPFLYQWILVLVLHGREYIVPKRRQCIPGYTWYVSGIYCQLGDYMLPTFYKNLKNLLTI